MAVFNVRCLALIALLMVGVLVSGHGVWAQGCAGDLQALALQCAQFVGKNGPQKPPSHECCTVIQKVDIPCVCKLVTKDMEKMVSVEKIIYVAKTCGRPLAPGTKCGSLIVPPPPSA